MATPKTPGLRPARCGTGARVIRRKTELEYMNDQLGYTARAKYAGRVNQTRVVGVMTLLTRLGLNIRKRDAGVTATGGATVPVARRTVREQLQEIVTAQLGAGFTVLEIRKTINTRTRGRHSLFLRAKSSVHEYEARQQFPALLAKLAEHAIQEVRFA